MRRETRIRRAVSSIERRCSSVRTAAGHIALGAILLGALAAPAVAEPSEDEFDSWLPSLAFSFDVHHQSFDVSATSDLGTSDKESRNVLTSVFSLDGGISTPALAEGFGSPRLFVQAGVQIPISDEHTILRSVRSFPPPRTEGVIEIPNPETLANCPEVDFPSTPPLNKESCDQSLSSMVTFNVNWSAGLGAEFTLPTPSRAFKIRAGVEYFGQSLDFDGEAQRDDRTGGTMPGSNGTIVESFIISGASTSKTLHAIGPRLTVSGEVGRAGPLSFSVFAETRLYWLLNGGGIKYGSTGTTVIDQEGEMSQDPGGSSSFVADPGSLIAQGGAGFRITWVGSR